MLLLNIFLHILSSFSQILFSQRLFGYLKHTVEGDWQEMFEYTDWIVRQGNHPTVKMIYKSVHNMRIKLHFNIMSKCGIYKNSRECTTTRSSPTVLTFKCANHHCSWYLRVAQKKRGN